MYNDVVGEVEAAMAGDETRRLTLTEAAQRSGHSPVTLRQAAQRGTLQAERVGEGNRATWYITEAALTEYLARRRTWKGYRRASRGSSTEA